jgi:hypothetical protein
MRCAKRHNDAQKPVTMFTILQKLRKQSRVCFWAGSFDIKLAARFNIS